MRYKETSPQSQVIRTTIGGWNVIYFKDGGTTTGLTIMPRYFIPHYWKNRSIPSFIVDLTKQYEETK